MRKIVFPGDSLPTVEEGLAELVLIGKDFNGNEITLEVPIPLRFATNQVVVQPAPIASPTATPDPTATTSPFGG